MTTKVGSVPGLLLQFFLKQFPGVLQRHESLASNLGAKLVGPLLLKSFDKLFDGPIKVTSPYGGEEVTVTWLDVIEFARTKPEEFILSDSKNGTRVCSFFTKQGNVEISEDDYRLVLSGAPQRMIPVQPIPEDEASELGTMEILEQRLALLIKRADLIAGRARQLNYHLKGRKTAIQSRRASVQVGEPHAPVSDSRSPPPMFQPVNYQPPTNGDNAGIHGDLLRQFNAEDRKPIPSRVKLGRTVTEPTTSSPGASTDPNRRTSHSQPGIDDGTGGQYRPLMTARIEKMARGEAIWPPCDRCRRLRMECTKHLTACSGCTKKHAKCTWKDINDEEIAYIVQMQASMAEDGGQDGADLQPVMDPGLHANGHSTSPTNGGSLSEENNILSQMASAATSAAH